MRKYTPLYKKKIYTPLYDSCNTTEQEQQVNVSNNNDDDVICDNSYFVDSFW